MFLNIKFYRIPYVNHAYSKHKFAYSILKKKIDKLQYIMK